MRPSIHWLLSGLALCDSSRMLTATIQTLYILSLGASLSTIAYLQIVHSVAYLFAAIGSAALVRLIGGKAAYLISLGLLYLYFLILFRGEFDRTLYLGQTAYAVGLAVIDTAGSDWVFGRTVHEDLRFREVMHDFRAKLFALNFLFMTAGSLSVFFLGYSSAYSLTLLSLSVVAIWMLLQPYVPACRAPEEPIRGGTIVALAGKALKSRNGSAYLIMAVITGLLLSAMVPVLHYWQPAMKQVSGEISESSLAILLWVTFASFSLSKSALHRCAKSRRLSAATIRLGTLGAPLALSLTSITLWLLSSSSGVFTAIAAIVLLSAFHCFHSFLTTELSSSFVETYCDRRTLVVFTAASSFLGRLLVIISLYVVAQSVDSSVSILFLWSFGMALSSFFLIALYWHFSSSAIQELRSSEGNPLHP